MSVPASSRRRRPAPRRTWLAPVCAAVSVLAAGACVLGGTQATLTATTSTAANGWAAGSIALSDDDSGNALVTAAGLRPGDSGSACIAVDYDGSLPAAVTLTVPSVTGTLAPYLGVSVQEGTGGGYGSCGGFTPSAVVWSGTASGFAAAASTYASGVGLFVAPAAGATRTYKLTYTLDAATPLAQQGAAASFDLRWESRAVDLGLLRAAGRGDDGQLGTGGWTAQTPTLTTVGSERTWTRVGAGDAFACGLQHPGTLWCWGANWSGQLGAAGGSRDVPTRVGAAADWVDVAAGADHACGIRADRSLWCWGDGGNGKLGVGGTAPASTPTAVAPGTSWASAAPGTDHTCGVRTDGTLWCWGGNAHGQLGRGDYAPQDLPVQVGASTAWTSVTSGGLHSCAVRTDGSAWCWGRGTLDQLGDGTSTTRLSPVQVGGSDWVLLTAGDSHTCGLHADRTLACWGSGAQGQLGTGAATAASPDPLAQTWLTVDAGGFFTCAIRSDRTRWCWGQNLNGDLGDGTTTTPRTVPTATAVAVAGLAAGTNFSFVLPWASP